MSGKSKNLRGKSQENANNNTPEQRAQHSRLVAGVLRRLYSDLELREFWSDFWECPTEMGVGKDSIRSIAHEALRIEPGDFDTATPTQKATWCLQIRDHPEMATLHGYAFRNLYQEQCANADAILRDNRPVDFITFGKETGMDPRQALFYLVAVGFGWLLVGNKLHQPLLFQALIANGIQDSKAK